MSVDKCEPGSNSIKPGWLAMEMYLTEHIDTKEISKTNYDAVICSAGYESRARFMAEMFDINASKRICFGFEEYKEEKARVENDALYANQKFDMHIFSGNNSEHIYGCVFQLLSGLNSNSRLLVDISCMTRAWTAAIVRAIVDSKLSIDLNVDFFYVVAEYQEHIEPYPPNEVVGPIPGFSSLLLPNNPTTLIMGLGQEPERAIGLKEYIDPAQTVIFYPIPGIDVRYDEDIYKNNEDIFKECKNDDQYSYPLVWADESIKKLESVILGHRKDSTVVLSSLGPKMFSLYCLLLASHYKDISVWRVTAGSREKPVDTKAARDSTVVLRVNYVPSSE